MKRIICRNENDIEVLDQEEKKEIIDASSGEFINIVRNRFL